MHFTPGPVPCFCQDAFSSTLLCLGGGKAQELLLLSGQQKYSHEEFHVRIPSVKKAKESNDIVLKTLSFSWIHSIISPWPLRPNECHLLIIQDGKKKNQKLQEALYSSSSCSPSAEDYEGALEDSKFSFKSSSKLQLLKWQVKSEGNDDERCYCLRQLIKSHLLLWTQNTALISQLRQWWVSTFRKLSFLTTSILRHCSQVLRKRTQITF